MWGQGHTGFAARSRRRCCLVFEQAAKRFSARVAAVDRKQSWTYRDLDATANQFARVLIDRGVHPGDRVGLLLNRAAETCVAMLAVMKAKATYVPSTPRG